MRPMTLVSLLAVTLFSAGLTAEAASSRNVAKKMTPVVSPDTTLLSEEVIGRGKRDEDARQAAQNETLEKLQAFLATQNPPIGWKPSLDDIEWTPSANDPNKLSVIRSFQTTRDNELEDVGPVFRATIQLNLTPTAYRQILAKDRQFRMEERHLMLAKLLGGLMALLAAIAGYVRLDELTKGYYTGWLRLGAVTFVGAVIAAVVMLL